MSNRLIHLLYAPTQFCNMGCDYCYLGEKTKESSLLTDVERTIPTLEFALTQFRDAAITPFNLSLHGGEVTTLPTEKLEELFQIIQRHYSDNFDLLHARGYNKTVPHLKTNLLNFHKLEPLFRQYRVSVSGSVDLPLKLHEQYRKSAGGISTLPQMEQNLRLLGEYPYRKKVSATIYRDHFEALPLLIEDIWRIHREFGFDMNNLNFMFGFDSPLSSGQTSGMLSGDEQVLFYEKLKEVFTGTELEEGFKRNWFDEFTPSYCTNSLNCGENFFLLQSDGSVYSCVRGQSDPQFLYGNIFNDSVEQILANGKESIKKVQAHYPLAEECRECEYLHLCKTGCPYVKEQEQSSFSYTCKLQKAIYRDNPLSYPPLPKEEQGGVVSEYEQLVHPTSIPEHLKGRSATTVTKRILLPNDLYEAGNSLAEIIEGDSVLQQVYSGDAIRLTVNDETISLYSQLLKKSRTLFNLTADDRIGLHIQKEFFSANCKEKVNNTLYLQMLRDTLVVYGDEERTKQEHLFTYQCYFNQLGESSWRDAYFYFDLLPLLKMNENMFQSGVLNNLFCTTSALRNYHYNKQKNNAFYHIQAINLPFQNFEFYWDVL